MPIPSPEAVRRARAFAERTLTPEEARAWLDAPMSDAERAEIRALHEWFIRRYPTPAERLAYARRASIRWRKAMPPAADDDEAGE
jgi:hypothetical protein